MKYDTIVESLGDFGPFQKKIYFLVCLVAVPHAFQLLGIVFTMGSQNHRCALPGFPNDTYNIQGDQHRDLIDRWIPRDKDGYSSCRIYTESTSNHTTNQTDTCSSYVYDTDMFESTITSEVDMVCDRKSLTTYSNMIFMTGMLVGSLVMGTLSDVIGRKKILMLGILGHWLSSLVLTFVRNYVLFVILRFTIAFFGISLFMTAFVIGIEIVGPKTRKFAGIIIELYFVVGLFINVLLAYFIRNWLHLQLVTALPTVLLLSLAFLIPESVRWLIRKRRYEEAFEIIQKAAKVNNAKLPEKMTNLKNIEDDVQEVKVWELFKSKVLLIRALILMFNWYVTCLVYFGLSLNVGALSGNIYLNFMMFALVEGLSYLTCLVFLDRAGRKHLLSVSMILAGVACLSTMFPVMFGGNDVNWLTQTLSLVGKFGSSIAFAVVFVYTAEIFPTSVRNSSVGICSFSARIGGIMSPYIADLGKVVPGKMGVALPLIVFGGSAIVAGLLALLLPETTNRILPETIQDAKDFGRNSPKKIYVPGKAKDEPSGKGSYEMVANSTDVTVG